MTSGRRAEADSWDAGIAVPEQVVVSMAQIAEPRGRALLVLGLLAGFNAQRI
jgi:hypothetical protein